LNYNFRSIDNKIISLLFYFAGAIISSILIIFIKEIRPFFLFRYSLKTILFLILSLISFIILDFSFANEKEEKNNLHQIENIFGPKPAILYVLIICLVGAYVEEILFRGYLYILFKNILYIFIKDKIIIEIIVIILISLIFSLLHISQGISGAIFSFIASIIFFISIFISSTIIYAMIFHFLFNFIEFLFIIPYKRKKYKLDIEENN